MNQFENISRKNYQYKQYNDYIFKYNLEKRANGVLSFLNIPYKITKIILSELTNFGPKIHRLDFAGEAQKGSKEICLILECQSLLPTEEDILRFFQYISSLRVLKKQEVELYILCNEKPPHQSREFVLKEGCIYTMHVISLKNINAKDIFKRIEDKIKNKDEITDEDIASLQLIAYTNYTETTLEILKKSNKLVHKMNIKDINEKEAILYILNVLSANMLDEDDKVRYMEETEMLINPREEYFHKKGIEEGEERKEKEIATKLLEKGHPLQEIIEITGLTKEQIQNAK